MRAREKFFQKKLKMLLTNNLSYNRISKVALGKSCIKKKTKKKVYFNVDK